MEVGDGHKNELIDLNTTCFNAEKVHSSIPSKPLLPVPASPLGMCDYGVNPFDQLMELTRKSINDKNDPFEMVFERAFGNKVPDTNSKVVTSCNTSGIHQSLSELEDTQWARKRVNQDGEISKMKLPSLEISGNISINPPDDSGISDSAGWLEESVSGRKEERIVNTAKLLDLPSPMFTRNAEANDVRNELVRMDFVNLKYNSSKSDESNFSKTNITKFVPENDSNGEAYKSNVSRNCALHEVVKSKLVDLPSPVFARTTIDTVEPNEFDRMNFELKHNSPKGDESNIFKSNTATLFPENDSNGEVQISNIRRSSASHENIKAIIADRVEKCIEKALNDSRKRFRSGSVTDLNFNEPKPELGKHRRSYSSSGLPTHCEKKSGNGSLQISWNEYKNNVPWLVGSNVSSSDNFNTGFIKSSSVGSRFSRSFDDLYADITKMSAKVSWGDSSCKVKEIVGEISTSKHGTPAACVIEYGSIRQTNLDAFNSPALHMEDDISSSSVFVEALSVSTMMEQAAGKLHCEVEEDTCLENVKPPWENINCEEIIIEIKDEDSILTGEKQLKTSSSAGSLRLKSDDSKILSDSNISFETSGLMNPVTHSTPVFRRDAIRKPFLRGEAKLSPLLPVVPVLNSSATAGTQKLRPLRTVSEQGVKKGPLKAVDPVVCMSRNTIKEEIAAIGLINEVSGQYMRTNEESSLAKIAATQDKNAMKTERLKSTPPSSRTKATGSLSTSAKGERNVKLLRRAVSLTSTSSPTLSKNPVGGITPVSDISQTTSSKMGISGRGRSRSFDVKESPKGKAPREPMLKSKSATSVAPLQAIAGRNLGASNGDKASNDLKTSGNMQNSPKITNKRHTSVNKVISKLKLSVARGKENIIPQH